MFVHIIKFKKKYVVRKNDVGEIIKFYYRGKYEAFEEDFDYFDYEIVIGHLDLASQLHSVHINEERNPLKKTQQILNQLCVFDGQDLPLVHPQNPFTSLLMLTDFKNEYPNKTLNSNIIKPSYGSLDSFNKANMRSTIRDKIIEED